MAKEYAMVRLESHTVEELRHLQRRMQLAIEQGKARWCTDPATITMDWIVNHLIGRSEAHRERVRLSRRRKAKKGQTPS